MAERFGPIATYLDSTNKTQAHLRDIRDGKYRLVFTTAETATEGEFLSIVLRDDRFRKRAVAFIFDELHTLDQWGRDFRPKFLQLGQIRKHLSVPVLIISATLTKEARKACETTLNMKDPVIVDVGTDRPNVFLRVMPMQHSQASFLDLLSAMPELWADASEVESVEERKRQFPVTLIYINNKDLDTVMYRTIDKWCTRASFEDAVDVYHADMSTEHLEVVRGRLGKRKTLIAICTDAFGMGADCRTVVRVFQWKLFGGTSAFWQRMGRAGRDFAVEAEATLFVESTYVEAETKKTLTATGPLPPVEVSADAAPADASLAKDVAVMRDDEKVQSRQVVDDELLALANHGIARDACIRSLVLEHLRQPEKEKLPKSHELTYPKIELFLAAHRATRSRSNTARPPETTTTTSSPYPPRCYGAPKVITSPSRTMAHRAVANKVEGYEACRTDGRLCSHEYAECGFGCQQPEDDSLQHRPRDPS
ncbi:hypothetical protein CF327_g1967 [Tilletia walkeri]|nr:hypothetical protein CF327_g1967 [Tilletia walkeri]